MFRKSGKCKFLVHTNYQKIKKYFSLLPPIYQTLTKTTNPVK